MVQMLQTLAVSAVFLKYMFVFLLNGLRRTISNGMKWLSFIIFTGYGYFSREGHCSSLMIPFLSPVLNYILCFLLGRQ